MNFEESLKQWVHIDNQLKSFGDKMKELREKKNKISESIHEYMEVNDITNKTVKLNDGQLKFGKIKETQPLTFKYLETCLKDIIKNEEQVNKIVEYVKNKRETKYVPEIKRYYDN